MQQCKREHETKYGLKEGHNRLFKFSVDIITSEEIASWLP